MIESLIGIIIGVLVGLKFDFGIGGIGGAAAMILFLFLADELVSMLKGTPGGFVRGALLKIAFCGVAIWIERRTGTPLSPYVILILMLSIYRRIIMPGTAAAGAK